VGQASITVGISAFSAVRANMTPVVVLPGPATPSGFDGAGQLCRADIGSRDTMETTFA